MTSSPMELLEGTTPGPWQWVGHDEIEQTEHPFNSVAEVVSTGPVKEQFHANARLIAAAPDLAREVASLRQIVGVMRGALLKSAAHCQGGHSDAGHAISEILGVPFPIRMDDLRKVALDEGLMPFDVWPWLEPIEDREARLAQSESVK